MDTFPTQNRHFMLLGKQSRPTHCFSHDYIPSLYASPIVLYTYLTTRLTFSRIVPNKRAVISHLQMHKFDGQ